MASKTSMIIGKMIPLLKKTYPGLTKQSIAEKLGVSARNITRYLSELKDIGFNLKHEGEKPKLWRIDEEVTGISAQDLQIVRELRERLKDSGNYSFEGTLNNLESKLSKISREKSIEETYGKLDGNELFHVYHGPNSDYHGKKSLISMLYQAIKDTKVLKVEYHKLDEDGVVTHICNPLGLALRQGRLYLVAQSRKKHGNIYTLYVARIRRVTTTGIIFTRPAFSFKEYYKHSIGAWVGEKPIDLKIKIHKPWLVEFLKELEIHPSKKIIREKQSNYLCLRICWGHDLKGWILSWGSYMEVMEPKGIRDEIEKETEDAFYHYVESKIPYGKRKKLIAIKG